MVNRVRCSAGVTENHNLVRLTPSLTSICSNSGACRMNSACCSRRAEAHHPLDAGAVVPGPVEQHDLTGGGQVLDVALEIPLGGFAFGGLLQRDDARAARVQVLHESLDGAALACGVTALENDDVPLAVGLAPLLQLQQLDLQQPLLLLVFVTRHPFVVRIALAPGVHDLPVGCDQHRIVVVVVTDGVDVGAEASSHGRRYRLSPTRG